MGGDWSELRVSETRYPVAEMSEALETVYFTEIPAVVLGPLGVSGDYAQGSFRIPFCTTESVLACSIQRGIKAVSMSGGCAAVVVQDSMSRAPVFRSRSVRDSARLCATVAANLKVLRQVTKTASARLRLLSSCSWVAGRLSFIRFTFDTGDAMGMNMVTIATQRITDWVVAKTGCRLVSLSSNVCADKKAAGVNFLLGRGKTVLAEAIIPANVLQEVLHVSASAVAEVVLAKHLVGSAIALAPGYQNSHVANILAGVFVATGQDVAQLVESSMGIVLAEPEADGSLYISITLPCLEVGTVGGGTQHPYAKRSLKLMECLGSAKKAGAQSRKLAEIIAGTCLAGELSLLASLAEGTLARAHHKHRGTKRRCRKSQESA